MQRREWVRAYLRVSAAAAAGAATAADAAAAIDSIISSSPISITWAGRHRGGKVRSPASAMNQRGGVHFAAAGAAAAVAAAAAAASVASRHRGGKVRSPASAMDQRSGVLVAAAAAAAAVAAASVAAVSSAARGEIYRYSAATNIDGDSSISSSSTRSVTDSARGS